jgi:hypothetical protein
MRWNYCVSDLWEVDLIEFMSEASRCQLNELFALEVGGVSFWELFPIVTFGMRKIFYGRIFDGKVEDEDDSIESVLA